MDDLDEGQHRTRGGASRQVCAECKEEQPRLPRLEASRAVSDQDLVRCVGCGRRYYIFDSTFFFFRFFLGLSSLRDTLRDNSAKITPAALSHCSVAALPSADTLRPAPAVAALLNASGSEDSHRGPYQQAS